MTEDEYGGLRELLEAEHAWPGLYTFKFVCKPEQQMEIEAATGLTSFEVKTSSKGNYISLTARMEVANPDAVIEIYRAARAIEGVMVL